jgi:DNA-binding PadR family transcriptional regulator
MRRLSTTSYAILGLLAIRSWTTYELAQQMNRALRHFWPRAESGLYEEPKNLVAHGLATASRQHVGRRPRTEYSITQEGRDALRSWLALPGHAPILEFEGLVKLFFAEQGSKDELLATLASIEAEVVEARSSQMEIASDVAETGGAFPHRLHVSALVFEFFSQYSEMLLCWTRWAQEQVESWPDDLTVTPIAEVKEIFERLAVGSAEASAATERRGA